MSIEQWAKNVEAHEKAWADSERARMRHESEMALAQTGLQIRLALLWADTILEARRIELMQPVRIYL